MDSQIYQTKPLNNNEVNYQSYGTLNKFSKLFVFLILISWLLSVCQYLGFLFLGSAGYLISIFMGLIFMGLILVPVWQPIVAILLIILVVFKWKKLIEPKWILITVLFTIVSPFITYLEYFQIIISFLGFVLSFVTYRKLSKQYIQNFPGKSNKMLYIIIILLIIIIPIIINFYNSYLSLKNASRIGQEAQKAIMLRTK